MSGNFGTLFSSDSSNSTIAASYWVSANFAASSTIPINFDSKEFDTGMPSLVTTSSTAWKFTAPVSGYYLITFCGTTGAFNYAVLYKNGSAYKSFGAVASGVNTTTSCSTIVFLNATDFIDVRPNSAQTMSGGTLASSGITNVAIKLI